MKRFTIITVCLNAADVLKDTIQSVLEQNCVEFEYLIKDGGSSDNTMDIAQSYTASFAARSIPYRIICQSDSGIYEAMNQATQESEGEWLLFMNAGDRFAGKHVLQQVLNSGKLEAADIVYGDRIMYDLGLYLYDKAHPLEEIRFILPFGHQSAFTKRELLIQAPYSQQYRICSDYRFYFQMYRERKRFAYLPFAVSIFDATGISSNTIMVHREKLKIFEEQPVRDEAAIQREQNLIQKNQQDTLRHAKLRKCIPQWIRTQRRIRMRKKSGWKTEAEFFQDSDL